MSDDPAQSMPLKDRPDIEEMVEHLAVRVHGAWMRQRLAEGWRWGKELDAAQKLHPCLVPYEVLPENQREADRAVARTSIQGLLDLGFDIRGSRGKIHGDEFASVREELETDTVPLAQLREIWEVCRRKGQCPAEVCMLLGERMLKQGEAILAYDVLSTGLATAVHGGQTRVRIMQLLALSLAQSGATERAGEMLLTLCAEGFDVPETLGLYGRVCKDLATKAATDAERRVWLKRAYLSYAGGAAKAEAMLGQGGGKDDLGDVIYCGINAATVAALLGNTAEAQDRAIKVKAHSQDAERRVAATGGKPEYWSLATLAEAELIEGDAAAAEADYVAAVALAGCNWREISSTRRQARLLAATLGLGATFADRLFPPLAVAVFAAPSDSVPMPDLKERLDREGVVAGYATAGCEADINFIEVMVETGREVHVILPATRVECTRLLKADLQSRLEHVLARAQSVTEDTQLSCLDSGVNTTFARLRATGAGLLRGRQLDVPVLYWPRVPGASPPPPSGIPGNDDYAVRAMLFADVKGYSKLSDIELYHFSRQYMPRVAAVLKRHEGAILSRRTAGDGLFLVFTDLSAAALVALELRDMVVGTHWEECGLPSGMGVRISLDAGPVYGYRDAITTQAEVCGMYVNRAARIEPITPPNQVYASEAFAALYVALSCKPLQFNYVGQTQLPKGFGWTPLYSCQPGSEEHI
jgi:hypothetical protein